ncbi:TetR/AcrR family transcriptional regulator [Hoeflea marina]|nr:TetR/AcrR family transcriptional regulator [Hoeflea marina]
MTTENRSAKDRILDAANQLFYGEGIRAVSVDAIAARAGVTKKTLYYHFKSKDDLIEAYLASRDQPNLALFKKWFDEAEGLLAGKVEAIFSNLSTSARHPRWKGCGFLRTAAELANMPGHPAMKVGAGHKKKFEAWLCEEFRARGAEGPEELARHIVLLMDGAFSTVLVHRDPDYILSAGRAASQMVARATQSTG